MNKNDKNEEDLTLNDTTEYRFSVNSDILSFKKQRTARAKKSEENSLIMSNQPAFIFN